jgi:hypothetical protein
MVLRFITRKLPSGKFGEKWLPNSLFRGEYIKEIPLYFASF